VDRSRPPRWLPFLVLGIGLLAISFGAILARFAQGHGLPSLAIATLRLGLAALFITPIALWQSGRTLRTLDRRQALLTCGAGFFLALHFATWITSLEYTSVASSTALVTTNLLWIGIASFVLFGERPSRLMLVGVVISLSGSLLIFWSDSRSSAPGSHPLLGNCLAIIGSWCFSAYLLIGRSLRATLPLPAYVWARLRQRRPLPPARLPGEQHRTRRLHQRRLPRRPRHGARPADPRPYLVQLVAQTCLAHLHRRRHAR
jgi:drug/metabolite transporter (DMT)-like permease